MQWRNLGFFILRRFLQRHHSAATQMGTTHCVTLSGARKRAVERVSVGLAEFKISQRSAMEEIIAYNSSMLNARR